MTQLPFKTIVKKFSALSFVFIILFGNFFLMSALLGATPHMIVIWGFRIGVVGALLGALLTLIANHLPEKDQEENS